MSRKLDRSATKTINIFFNNLRPYNSKVGQQALYLNSLTFDICKMNQSNHLY